jgi:hypothetical protein
VASAYGWVTIVILSMVKRAHPLYSNINLHEQTLKNKHSKILTTLCQKNPHVKGNVDLFLMMSIEIHEN